MTFLKRLLKPCGISYQHVISCITTLMVTSLFVVVYGILGGRSFPRNNINLVASIQRNQYMPPSVDILEVEGGADNERCINLPTGKPKIRPLYLPYLKNPCWYADDGELRCLPYFYLAGLPKCGTTDLYKQVSKHPDIIKATCKEPHWMSKRRFFVRNNTFYKRDIMHYPKFFKGLATAVLSRNRSYYQSVTGDASASTFWCNEDWNGLKENCGLKEPRFVTAHYIKYLLPRVKIMAIMRNPTDRLYSDYLYFQSGEKSNDDFHNKVVNAINSFYSCLSTSSMRACAYNATNNHISVQKVRLHIGLYDVFLQDWMNVFPKEQLHFIRFEDYIKNRMATIKDIYQFLEIRPLTSDEEVLIMEDSSVSNANTRKKNSIGPMRPDTRRMLDDFYRPHNEQLAKLLSDENYLW